MNPKRAKRFERLKQQAIITLYELETLTGGDSVVHEKNKFIYLIRYRVKRLTEEGEEIVVFKRRTIWYTVEGLEQMLKEANAFIAKVKLRGR